MDFASSVARPFDKLRDQLCSSSPSTLREPQGPKVREPWWWSFENLRNHLCSRIQADYIVALFDKAFGYMVSDKSCGTGN